MNTKMILELLYKLLSFAILKLTLKATQTLPFVLVSKLFSAITTALTVSLAWPADLVKL